MKGAAITSLYNSPGGHIPSAWCYPRSKYFMRCVYMKERPCRGVSVQNQWLGWGWNGSTVIVKIPAVSVFLLAFVQCNKINVLLAWLPMAGLYRPLMVRVFTHTHYIVCPTKVWLFNFKKKLKKKKKKFVIFHMYGPRGRIKVKGQCGLNSNDQIWVFSKNWTLCSKIKILIMEQNISSYRLIIIYYCMWVNCYSWWNKMLSSRFIRAEVQE